MKEKERGLYVMLLLITSIGFLVPSVITYFTDFYEIKYQHNFEVSSGEINSEGYFNIKFDNITYARDYIRFELLNNKYTPSYQLDLRLTVYNIPLMKLYPSREDNRIIVRGRKIFS